MGGSRGAGGWNDDGQLKLNGWTDIVAVAAGRAHTLGLKSDGTVVAAGYNECGACNVSDWKDIVEIAAGDDTSFGVKADGTVVTVGYVSSYGNMEVDGWTDIADPNS